MKAAAQNLTARAGVPTGPRPQLGPLLAGHSGGWGLWGSWEWVCGGLPSSVSFLPASQRWAGKVVLVTWAELLLVILQGYFPRDEKCSEEGRVRQRRGRQPLLPWAADLMRTEGSSEDAFLQEPQLQI